MAAVQEIPDAELYSERALARRNRQGHRPSAAGKKRDAHSAWLALETQFYDRILGLDIETAKLWGELTARAQKTGVVIPATDGLLAATALRHGLHVMTRNESISRRAGPASSTRGRGTFSPRHRELSPAKLNNWLIGCMWSPLWLIYAVRWKGRQVPVAPTEV